MMAGGTHLGHGRLVRVEGVLSRRVATGVLVLAPSAPDAVLLSGTGAALWDLLGEGSSLDEVIGALAESYGVDAEVVAVDLGPTVAELLDRGLVVSVA